MTTLLLVACVGMITGAFLILRISPMDFTNGIFQKLTSAPKSIRSDVNETTRRKKPGFLRRGIRGASHPSGQRHDRRSPVSAPPYLSSCVGAGIAIVWQHFTCAVSLRTRVRSFGRSSSRLEDLRGVWRGA
jgi:hypothetical protein